MVQIHVHDAKMMWNSIEFEPHLFEEFNFEEHFGFGPQNFPRASSSLFLKIEFLRTPHFMEKNL
jgi:hypothetical protein